MHQKVTVLGASGMLGSMLATCFSNDPRLEVSATVRTEALAAKGQAQLPGVAWRLFDATAGSEADVRSAIMDSAWVVNAIGITKPYINDDNAATVERAIRVNAIFPYLLARAAEKSGAQVIQIATDCVYSGAKGPYKESDQHDALDVYGKTKSLGEVSSPNVSHLRCSIIGPEPRAHVFLLDWFLGQEHGSAVNGYTNHLWNGITTLHFAKLCQGIIHEAPSRALLQHVVPSGRISKAAMLACFAESGGRQDIHVNHAPAPVTIDRTLATEDERSNQRLWQAAGYDQPPTVPQMIEELFARHSHTAMEYA